MLTRKNPNVEDAAPIASSAAISVHIANRKAIRCGISRVVPGRLLYVTPLDHPDRTYAVKLNTVLIEQPDGSVTPYRGEPLPDIGLVEGKEITVWKLPLSDPPDILVVKAPCPSRSLSTMARKITAFVPFLN